MISKQVQDILYSMFSNSFIIRIYTQCFPTVLLSGYILNVFQQFYYQDIYSMFSNSFIIRIYILNVFQQFYYQDIYTQCFPTVLLSAYIYSMFSNSFIIRIYTQCIIKTHWRVTKNTSYKVYHAEYMFVSYKIIMHRS